MNSSRQEQRDRTGASNSKQVGQQAGLHDDELLDRVADAISDALPGQMLTHTMLRRAAVAAVRGAGPSGGVDSLAEARGFTDEQVERTREVALQEYGPRVVALASSAFGLSPDGMGGYHGLEWARDALKAVDAVTLSPDERRALWWAIDDTVANQRREAKSFPEPATGNVAVLESLRATLRACLASADEERGPLGD